jgi:uncharacterized membrane protein YphA (DoxX/SURF4 family)
MTRSRRIAFTVARVVLGLVFVASGLTGLLGLAPPPEGSPGAVALFQALHATGYILPLLKVTELVGGALVLGGLFLPLGLVLLAPVIVNIVAFHVFVAPAGLPIAAVLVTAALALAWRHRAAFAPLFVMRARAPRSDVPASAPTRTRLAA